MNNIQNKALLWDICIKNGMFTQIPKEQSSKIQSTFETVVDSFSSRDEPIELLNKECIIKIKEEISKLNSNTSSFDARQKDYDSLLNKPPPPKIDFSDKIDEPIQDINKIVERAQTMRQETFKFAEPRAETQSIDWVQVIKSQNNILMKILETQHKILDVLNKK
jgi:hypothetical protein